MSLLSDKMLGVIVFLARLDTRGKCLSRFMRLYSEIGSETDRQTEYIYIYIYVSLILGVNVSLAGLDLEANVFSDRYIYIYIYI